MAAAHLALDFSMCKLGLHAQAKLSQVETKASQLAQQLKELKAQKSAAESRNIVLEKVYQLQGSCSLDRSRLASTGAVSSTLAIGSEADNDGPSAFGSSELAPCKLYNRFQHPFDVDAMLKSRRDRNPSIQLTAAQLRVLEWEDFVKLMKEYISRYPEA